MDIKDYIRKFNLPFDKVKTDFKEDFDSLFAIEKEWLGNLEDKIHLLKNSDNENAIRKVVQKLKEKEDFTESDTPLLSIFVSKINTIVRIANRINNFKEGKQLDNGVLRLYDFFNTVKSSENLQDFNYQLNSNLVNFLPHIFSVIKHCQNPNDYPIYYKYWKNILREVLIKDDNYDSMCVFYRTFPTIDRHLNFATYLGVIGIQIAKNINSSGIHLTKDSKDYKYLTKDVINIERYNSILDDQLSNKTDTPKAGKQYWLYAPGENAYKWDEFYELGIMALGWDELGDIRQYNSRDEIKNALIKAYGGKGSKKNDVSANDDFVNKINIGDIVIAKKGRGELLGFGEVTSDYIYDENRSDYNSIRKVNWKLKGNWKVNFNLVLKTLTDITGYPSDHDNYDKHYELLLGIMTKEINSNENDREMSYPLNTIFYGPPGTGKTYNTILRAAEIIENRRINNYNEALEIFKKNLHNQIEFITFHQNYSYEDFIQGLRPNIDNTDQLSFERKDGIFKIISDRALENLRMSENDPELQSKNTLFDIALDGFIDKIQDSEENYKIPDSVAYIIEVTDNAFRYKGDNWGSSQLMKFKDLKELFLNNIENRQDIKKLTTVSGLARQHASYFLRVYNEIISLLPEKIESKSTVTKQNYVLIIDEINRANISRVFGELITLIEPDKRSHGKLPLETKLPSGETFIVPSNLYIIGTMNTADKSIALLDIALRRRFEFEAMYPKYEIEGQIIHDVDILQKINEQIIKSKGHDFQIGHAYFMGENSDLIERMNKKIIPLLLEYYMNDEKEVKGILQSAGLKVVDNSWPLKISGKNEKND